MGKLTDKDKQRAYELYKEGATDAQIAARFGVTRQAVFQWRHVRELPANGKKGQKRPKMVEEPVVILGSNDMGTGGLGATGVFGAAGGPETPEAPKPAPAPKDPAAERGEAFLKIAYELGLAFGKGLREGLKE